jgi:hypothetical protein
MTHQMKQFEKHFIIILFDIFFDIYFLTDDSQLFFLNYTLNIFLFVLTKNLLLNIRTLKEKTKNVF